MYGERERCRRMIIMMMMMMGRCRKVWMLCELGRAKGVMGWCIGGKYCRGRSVGSVI